MSDDKFVELSADDKECVLKSTKDLFFAAKQLHEWIHDGQLKVDMKDVLTSLIESHFVDVSKLLDYESHLAKEHEQRYIDIRKANGRIRELEQMLADSKPIDGLGEQMRKLYETVRDWWNKDGFHHVGEFKYWAYGQANMEFCFMLDYSYSHSRTPASDRLNKEQYIERLKKQGYEIQDIKGDGLKVIDTPNNRGLLTELLKQRFPSLKIHKFNNWSAGRNDDIFVLRNIEASIYDLKDIPVGSESIEH